MHVDGAIGLFGAGVPAYTQRTAGLTSLDSWPTDGHKLLNVAYDCGIAITRHADAHRAAMRVHASHLVQDEGAIRESLDWNPSPPVAPGGSASTRPCVPSGAAEWSS